jgi:glycosyltransferase involved in cell wall biosynthesis
VIRILGLALYGPLAASTRYRLGQYVEGLRSHGIELQVRHLLDDQYLARKYAGGGTRLQDLAAAAGRRLKDLLGQGGFDASMLYGELLPLLPGTLESALLRLPFVYDCDDAFYLKYRQGRLALLRGVLGRKFDRVMRGAAHITAGNRNLVAYGARQNPNTHYLPTVVDTRRYLPARDRRSESVFTVGWIGSPSTSEYLSQLVEPLAAVGREGPVRFVVIGGQAPAVPGVEVVTLPWSEAEEVRLINSFDVGVMPLPDTEWARGKCAFKLIQYMACAVPVIASPVGANVDVVNGECGLLAAGSDQWIEAFRTLRDSPARRSAMGSAARARIEEHYSLQTTLPVLAGILRQAAGRN